MKHKPIVSEKEKNLFASGFRVTQGDHEFVTYPENTSIRIWHSETPDEYDMHFHSATEAILPLVGNVVVQAEEETFIVCAGEIIIIPPGCSHSLHMDAGCERELLLFEPNGAFSLKEFSALRQMMSKPIYLSRDMEMAEKIRTIFFEIIRVHRSGTLLRNLHNYARLMEAYALLGEEYMQTEATAAEMNALQRQISGEDAFNRALDYLNKNYMDDLTLDSLASYAGFSRFTLSRMFRQHTGFTFTQCLAKRRVDMAMDLLTGTKMPVTQVALQCGFNSIATFNRVFREMRGCTPTQYRVIYTRDQSGDANTMYTSGQ
ncbi:MAG: helix-turn-helix transcriptional regulator [Clostridia bacterium]|nr:helix-turn-helix transcriptional regulator [Clostridia bacterium]